MLVKSQVKYIQSLGHKKFRDEAGVFVAEGPKIVDELLSAENLSLVQCYATQDWLRSNSNLQKYGQEYYTAVEERELERISSQTTPNQVLAVFTKPKFDVGKPSFSLLLDNIQDPGNLGTIIRTADWFGVEKIVCSSETVDVFNPKVVQSAMGSLIRVEVIYTDLSVYIRSLPDVPLYSSSIKGKDLVEKIRLSKGMLLMGNESKGISPELEKLAKMQIRIPRAGGAESLNVAVATGILLSNIEWIS